MTSLKQCFLNSISEPDQCLSVFFLQLFIFLDSFAQLVNLKHGMLAVARRTVEDETFCDFWTRFFISYELIDCFPFHLLVNKLSHRHANDFVLVHEVFKQKIFYHLTLPVFGGATLVALI